MAPVLPFGPLSLPTGPIVTLIAVILGLEAAGRYGKRLGLAADDVWNIGLLACLTSLIVARLWNVIQFWDIYRAEPALILSLRPGGFVLLPGLIAALVIVYLYLLRKAMDPIQIAAVFTMGALAAGVLLKIGDFLTGAVIGVPSKLPWALAYYGELRHPVALYQAFGLGVLWGALWLYADASRPGRTILLAALGYSLLHVGVDAFVDGATFWGSFRASQVVALGAALALTLMLARTAQASEDHQTTVRQS